MPFEYLRARNAYYDNEQTVDAGNQHRFFESVEAMIQANLAALQAFKDEAAKGPRVATNIPAYGFKSTQAIANARAIALQAPEVDGKKPALPLTRILALAAFQEA